MYELICFQDVPARTPVSFLFFLFCSHQGPFMKNSANSVKSSFFSCTLHLLLTIFVRCFLRGLSKLSSENFDSDSISLEETTISVRTGRYTFLFVFLLLGKLIDFSILSSSVFFFFTVYLTICKF